MITEQQFAQAVDSRSRLPIYEKMKRAHIGIAGLGGLGSNIAAALVRSGVGKLTIADFDTVELSNINRQLYTPQHIGMKKTEALTALLHEINPFCEITAHHLKIDERNAADIFGGCGIVCEAFDVAEHKAMLVSMLLSAFPEMQVICGSGMAGFGRANEIVTRCSGSRLTVCGDGVTDVADGDGLTAARVMICAGHMASRAVEIILNETR